MAQAGCTDHAADVERWITSTDNHGHVRHIQDRLKPSIFNVLTHYRYQATSVAEIEFTLGYIAAILTVSAQCLLPRAKYTKILFFSVLASCGAAALCCIAVVCCVRARQNSTPANATQAEREGYNSSASVVSGVWLLLGVWYIGELQLTRRWLTIDKGLQTQYGRTDPKNYKILWLQLQSLW